jgi:type VI secretion system protein ImpA
MPLRDDVLTPIPGANSAGESLRYAPVYEKIKEARRHEDDDPQGAWQRERKVADWPLTIKLLTEALSRKSKDLQLAAWLTEALLRRDGIAGLREGLDILYGLVENFWDTLYPEIEDGDAEFRAAPLQWVGENLETAVRSTPLTRSGLNSFQYKESRKIGYEADAAASEAKAAERQEAIAEGKPTAEEFDAQFEATPKVWYVQLEAGCDAALESIDRLSELCDARFGEVAPSYRKLREVIEEIRQIVHVLLQKKREKEPDPVEPETPSEALGEGSGAAAAPARAAMRMGAEPVGRDDAVAMVVGAARYLRRTEPGSPAPYLMLRGLRWGELRTNGKNIDLSLLEAPPSETRQHLKRLMLQSNWKELLEAAENAMGTPYGRGWLDIQRYVCRACSELGRQYSPIAEAVKTELKSLLSELPGLPESALMDDTASASADTLTWLKDIGVNVSAPPRASSNGSAAATDEGPDPFEIASRAVTEGRSQEGLEILNRELARERSGRGRFQRKVQMAQLCLSIGREAIAFPLLNDLAAEIEQRKLEEWESPDAVAHPLALLFQCLEKLEGSADEKRRLYERICRLDPAQAMSCTL